MAGSPQTEAAFLEARSRYLHAAALYQALGDPEGEAEAIQHVAISHFQLGETLDAITAWRKAAAMARAAGSRRVEGACLMSLGAAYRRLGSFDESLEAYTAVYDMGPKAGDEGANPLTAIGNIYSAMGEHRNALDYFERALALIREEGKALTAGNEQGSIGRNRHAERQTRLWIAAEHGALGDSRRAIDWYRTLIADCQDSVPVRSEAYRAGAKLLLAVGDHSQAIDWLEDALALHEKFPSGRAGIQIQLGTTYALLGEPARAFERLDQALAGVRPSENAANVGPLRLLAEAGIAYGVAGRPEKAVVCFTQGAAAARAASQAHHEARFLALLARAARDMGQLDAARGHIEQAIAKRESIRLRLHSPDQRSVYFSTFRWYYDFQADSADAV